MWILLIPFVVLLSLLEIFCDPPKPLHRPSSPEENGGMCICGSAAKDHPGFVCRYCGGCV